MSQQADRQTISLFERVEDGDEVFYSIYSRYDGGILHLDPEQLRELQQWLTVNADTLEKDVQSC